MSDAVAAPSAAELAAGVRQGRLDPVELVERALARIAECDDRVGAFVVVDAAGALAQARDLPDGPLRGVPVGVKDLFDVAGQVTRAGSAVPPGPAAARDAAAVARLRAAGAVVVGRTRTHEFTWGITTQHEVLGGTGNPWDTSRVPGGSSGGSAAAVAAGMVPLALGTDTGCSIRLPSAWCGTVGHKPTWGRVPLDGCTPLAPSMDCAGPLARTVADARLALEVLSDAALPEPAPVRGLRLGVVAVPDGAVEPAVRRLLERAADRAAQEGLTRHDVRLPLGPRDLTTAYVGVQAPEALAWHRGTGRWPRHERAYGRGVRASLTASAALPAEVLEAAQELRRRLREGMAELFSEVDVLLAPVAGCGPTARDTPDVGALGPVRDAVLPWTVPVNLCGLPACAVPVGLDDDGMPVGLQVIGPPGSDARVLDVAERLQVPLS